MYNETILWIEIDDEVPCCLSQRWKTAYVGFFGFICVYAVRVNLSVAIVCMVKSQNLTTGGTEENGTIIYQGPCRAEAESSSVYEVNWGAVSRLMCLSVRIFIGIGITNCYTYTSFDTVIFLFFNQDLMLFFSFKKYIYLMYINDRKVTTFKNQTWIDPMTVQLLSRTSKMKT